MSTRGDAAAVLSAVLLLALVAGTWAAASQPRLKPRLWARGGATAAAFAADAAWGSKALGSRSPRPGSCRVVGLVGGMASGKSTVAQLLRERGAVVIDADKLGHAAYAPGTPGHAQVVAAFGTQVLDPRGAVDRAQLRNAVFGTAGASGSGGASSGSSSGSSSGTSSGTSSVAVSSGGEAGGGGAQAAASKAQQQKAKLESIVWPLVREAIEARIAEVQHQQRNACVVVEAALLLEAGWADLCDEIWAVVVDEDVAVERLLRRDPHVKAADAAARVRASEGADRTIPRPPLGEPTAGEPTATTARAARLAVCSVVLENSGGLGDLEAQVEAAWRSRRLAGDDDDACGDDDDEGGAGSEHGDSGGVGRVRGTSGECSSSNSEGVGES